MQKLSKSILFLAYAFPLLYVTCGHDAMAATKQSCNTPQAKAQSVKNTTKAIDRSYFFPRDPKAKNTLNSKSTIWSSARDSFCEVVAYNHEKITTSSKAAKAYTDEWTNDYPALRNIYVGGSIGMMRSTAEVSKKS